jgi:hypothetical protein
LTKTSNAPSEKKRRYKWCIRVVRCILIGQLIPIFGLALAISVIFSQDYEGFMRYNHKMWYNALLITIILCCWTIVRLSMMYCLSVCLQPAYPPTKLDLGSSARVNEERPEAVPLLAEVDGQSS